MLPPNIRYFLLRHCTSILPYSTTLSLHQYRGKWCAELYHLINYAEGSNLIPQLYLYGHLDHTSDFLGRLGHLQSTICIFEPGFCSHSYIYLTDASLSSAATPTASLTATDYFTLVHWCGIGLAPISVSGATFVCLCSLCC